jgi:hypothetical protein
MKRFLLLIPVLFVSTSIGGCVSAAQKIDEQRELERSIRKTSDPEAVKRCSFMMKLRPDGLHSTPEAQAASLVLPQPGVSWVVFGGSGNYELYSCPQKTPQDEQEAQAPTPTPVETKPIAGTSASAEAKAAPAPLEAKPEVVTRRAEAKAKAPEQAERIASKTRVTNNPEAVKGCKFLESFVEYQKVARFQEDVVRAGGNVGYIVAATQDGDVIGESYLCSEDAKP